jgi:hypothetical protein|eukprot:CAMPEP_0185574812 /NCGR_PEP_ID=MMETSP0434-20130131/6173_1 /TAXON_ID=626734 ORGANISM="Favella taraikaensis, Strain Fe Narragansett Bay" /NCGR_SAMPLE_ID=MMETSP0434 /ASSEMBLY_ACC=CAM_ASM_000379 /LENGTH=39 /DNA_ID= /DNA_START= /DNA_END= /DNA_ORIENTATION=
MRVSQDASIVDTDPYSQQNSVQGGHTLDQGVAQMMTVTD